MKLTIEQSQFAEAMLFADKAVERRNTLPILSCVLLDAQDGKLTVTGTNLEIKNSITVDADIEQDGKLALPSKKLADIAKATDPTKPIKISVNKNKATVTSGRSRFTLSGLNANEFPEWQVDANASRVNIDPTELQQAISSCVPCMAQQDVRYYLNGMCFTVGERSVEVAATDGHRLALKSVSFDGSDSKQSIIPASAVIEINKLLNAGKETQLLLGDNQAVVTQDNLVMYTKLIDGKYPNYQRIIPRNNDDETVINRLELISAVKRALLLSNEKYRGIKMSITASEISFTGNNPEQEESFEKITCRHSGPEKEIGVNGLYVLDAVSSMQGENVTLLTGDPSSAMMIQEDDLTMVLMPMRL